MSRINDRVRLQFAPSLTVGSMSSAKLQVRPILLKKISFMIFFNNYPSDYESRRRRPIEKKKSTMVRQAHHPERSRRNDFFFSKNCSAEVVG
jgi:hypothetical protein